MSFKSVMSWNSVIASDGAIHRRVWCFCRYIAVVCGFLALLPSTSNAVDEQQCMGVLNPTPLPPLVDKAAEEYSFHYANIVSIYASMYSVMDKHCSEALGAELSLKKDAVIGHLLMSFPSNKMMENDGFRKCLLSHFHKKGSSSNQSLILMEKSLNQLTPFFEKRFTQFKAAAQKTNEKYTDYQICKGAFLLKSLVDGLKRHHVEAIDPEGTPFDPQLHQAMAAVEQADVEPNTVLNVYQKGYTLHGRLVRPAMVVVSKATAS